MARRTTLRIKAEEVLRQLQGQGSPSTKRRRTNRSDKSKYQKPGETQHLPIGPLTKDELKSPKSIGVGEPPYANKGASVSFVATGPKMGKGKVPNDVLARYRKAMNQAKMLGKPVPYLEYNGSTYYYQSRGRSLTSLDTKLEVVDRKTKTEQAKTPTLDDYKKAFPSNPRTAQALYDREQRNLNRIKPGVAGTKTPPGYSRGHIRPNAQGGFWHSRNLKLENTQANAQQRVQTNPAGVEQLLNLHATNNVDHIALQGPDPNPRQRQDLLKGKRSVSRARFTPRQTFQQATQAINDLQAIQEARVNSNQHLPAPRIGLI